MSTRVLHLIGYVLAFAAAIWALQAGWVRFRAVWESPTPAGWAATAAYLAVFLAAFLYLGYWQYAADRAAGRVRRPLWMYERFLRRPTSRVPKAGA